MDGRRAVMLLAALVGCDESRATDEANGRIADVAVSRGADPAAAGALLDAAAYGALLS